jgi:hypothetical protein
VREYFRNGKLPNNGTICGHESTVFPEKTKPVEAQLIGEDKDVIDAWRDLSKSFEVPRLGAPF